MTPSPSTPTSDEVLLEVSGLSVRYAGVPAVNQLDLTIRRGEVVGLIGPNGAGKSSTLLAIMGSVPTAAGTVTLEGKRVTGRRPEDIVKQGISLVPEGRMVFPQLSVKDNLRLGLVGRRSKAGAQESWEYVHDLFPILREFEDRSAGLLSGGQQQQLSIGRSLLADPTVLMLDEPSLGLAPSVVDTVFDALEAVKANGTAILLVEQRAQLTVAFADRTYVLRDGEVTHQLTPESASDDKLFTEAYFGS